MIFSLNENRTFGNQWVYPKNPDLNEGNGLVNLILPKNPVTGARRLNLYPTFFGKLSSTFYLQSLSNRFNLSFKRWPTDRSLSYQRVAEKLLSQLTPHVPTCYGKPWNFKIHVVSSSSLNAFALPDGTIVIFDKLIDDICNFCSHREYDHAKNSKLQTGSYSNPSFDGIAPEDILASIIAHEMVHICARHRAQKYTINIIATFILLELALWLQTFSKQLKGVVKLLANGNTIPSLRIFLISLVLLIKEYLVKHLCVRYKGIFDNSKSEENSLPDSKFLLKLNRDALFYIAFYKTLYLAKMSFNRQCEYESDYFGMLYSARAGFDPRGSLLTQIFLEKSNLPITNYFKIWTEVHSSHPNSRKRQHALIKHLYKNNPEFWTEDEQPLNLAV